MSTDGKPPSDDLDDNTVEPEDPRDPETGTEPDAPEPHAPATDQAEQADAPEDRPTEAEQSDEPSSPPPEPFEDPTGEKFAEPAASDPNTPTNEPPEEPSATESAAEPPSPGEVEIPGGPAPETPQDETPSAPDSSAESPSEEAPSTSPSYYEDPYDEEYEYGYGTSDTPSETKAIAKSGSGGSPPPPPDDDDDSDSDEEGMTRMSFLEHLEELRTRIIQSAIGLVAAYLISLIFAKDLFSWVRGPIQRSFDILNEQHGFDPPLYLVAITPQEQFHLIYLKVPLLAAVFVAAPWLVYQAWSFIAPGLYQRERRWAHPFIFCVAGLFILGGLFGYFVVLKFALTFLLGIGIDSDIRPMISVSSYFSTFVMIELGLGVVFQMPVLIFFLTLLRIVNPAFLLGNVRYAILIIFVIAAVVTPTPDVFNMILFAAPMILLFYVGIGASFLLVMKRERGKIPWVRITLVALLILAVVAAAGLYFMHSQLGYNFTNQFPWIVPPPE